VEWLRDKKFQNPDEVMGPEGDKYRARFGSHPIFEAGKQDWRDFLANEHRSSSEIARKLNELYKKAEAAAWSSLDPKKRKAKRAAKSEAA
jgi:hypothetical protein